MNELIGKLLVLFMLLMSARLASASPKSRAGRQTPSDNIELATQTSPEPPPLTPEQRRWAEKAVKRYAEAQEKKWRRWNEAMFERMD